SASHLAPPSQVTSTAPSFPYITCWLFSGSTQMAWLSTWPMLLSPCQVLPPSVDLVGPTPPRYTTSGLFGSTRIWLKYIGRWFSLDMNAHVRPLSFDRHTPDVCGFGRAAAPPRPPPRPPRPPTVSPSTAPPPAGGAAA